MSRLGRNKQSSRDRAEPVARPTRLAIRLRALQIDFNSAIFNRHAPTSVGPLLSSHVVRLSRATREVFEPRPFRVGPAGTRRRLRSLNGRALMAERSLLDATLTFSWRAAESRRDATGSANVNVPRYAYPAYVTLIGPDARAPRRRGFSVLLAAGPVGRTELTHSILRESLIRAPNIRRICDYVKVERLRYTPFVTRQGRASRPT